MQQLIASLVTSMSVKDAAFESGMKAASARAKKTEQDLERSTDSMGNAVERAADRINTAMIQAGEAVASVGQKVTRAGVALTAGITVPLALVGKRSKDTAADFETAMNRVQAAMLDASPAQLQQLSDTAMKLGPAMGRSSIEAAGAIEMLAKNGMSAAAILNGGLTAAMRLAVVGQTELAGASDLTTDILAQFTKTSSDLPDIVNKVSGALDVSKMGFDDYRLAIGQAGGVAGGLGVPFEDLNVALAATASTFASGSDAGTSFKTFLTSLNPVSKEAAGMMKQLGIEFFDATGKAKPLTEVAEILRQKLSGLSDQKRRDALTTMFGSDGMRTAIALMNQGAAGIERYRGAINKVTADQKMAVLLEGDAAASARLATAIENLSIKLGQVLLPVFAAVKNAAAAGLQWLADLPAAFHYAWIAAGLFAASLGPVLIAMVTLSKMALPLFALRLGAIPVALAAIINPMGLVVSLMGRLALQAGAATMVGMLGTRLIALAGPLGVAISLLTLLWPLLFRTATASDAVRKAQDAANKTLDLARERSLQLATATGQLRKELIAKAKADGQQAVASLKAAAADMVKARAALARAKAERASIESIAAAQGGTAPGAVGSSMRQRADDRIAQAEADLRGQMEVVKTYNEGVRGIIADIRNATAQDTGTSNPNFGGGDSPKSDRSSGPKGKTAEDRAREQAQYQDELGRIRVATLEATADLTGAITARYDAEMAAIEEERASYARSVALDDGLNEAKRAALIAAKEGELAQKEGLAEQRRSAALAQERYDLGKASNEAAQETVRAEMDLADSASARRAAALRLLDLQRRQEEADLDLIMATEATSSTAWSNARARKDQLDAIYGQRQQQAERDNEGPMDAYRRDLNRSAAAVNESIESIQVAGFEKLNDWMADAVMGADDLAKSFRDMTSSIIRDLVRIVVQQQLIKPLANMLGGGGDAGGGFLRGLLGGAKGGGASLVSTGESIDMGPNFGGLGGLFGKGWNVFSKLGFGGGKASGGRVGPGNWYMVGEHGPEPFVPDSAGTIHPNRALRGGRGAPPVVELIVGEGKTFESRVEAISGNVSIRTTRAATARQQMRARQAL
ncbi:phage tail tape measure protein [Sphingomonas sp. Leaf10]|uniref:phage tail tape measure protein n=1 Tax=Sphingomonas sp. Leaf10 TaxID=1735676 RepID=UPI0006FC1089|nr:phage tail tape measure protein [Sphingomonas sp. Leaf10]KQM37615.1 hypothetical protein ASE59_14115 [Sphingomonas sp. Leaf10]